MSQPQGNKPENYLANPIIVRNNKSLSFRFFKPLSFGGLVRQQTERGQVIQNQFKDVDLHSEINGEPWEGFKNRVSSSISTTDLVSRPRSFPGAYKSCKCGQRQSIDHNTQHGRQDSSIFKRCLQSIVNQLQIHSFIWELGTFQLILTSNAFNPPAFSGHAPLPFSQNVQGLLALSVLNDSAQYSAKEVPTFPSWLTRKLFGSHCLPGGGPIAQGERGSWEHTPGRQVC